MMVIYFYLPRNDEISIQFVLEMDRMSNLFYVISPKIHGNQILPVGIQL